MKESLALNILKIKWEMLFIRAHKRTVNLPAMHIESLPYDRQKYILKLLSKYLGADVLTKDEITYLKDKLSILSGLYGL